MNDSPRNAATPEAPAPAEKSSRWEDLIDIFIAPADLFRRRAADRVGPPLLMLLAASFVLYLVLMPANRLIIQASQQAANPQAAAFMEQYGMLFQLIGAITVPITMLVMVAFGALLVWLFAKLVGTQLELGRALLISTYAGFVLVLGQVADAVLVLLHADGALEIHRDLSLGPLRFLDVDVQSTAVPLLRRLEPFSIWQAALWGVGVRHVTGSPAGRAALIAGLAWAAYALPQLLFSMVAPGVPG
jgi:hypothetical protein